MSSLSRPYLGTRLPSILDRTGSEIPDQSGIFLGVVKKIDTTTRTGRLWVYITKLGGPDADDPTNWKLVSYASPFFGQTLGGSSDYTAATISQNVFNQAPQSYGFHMIPPDIGNKVLCCFLSGTIEGFWFACVNNSSSIYMTPAIGAIDYRYIQPNSIPSGIPALDPNKRYPVGDWNENLREGYSKPTQQVQKPLHIPKTIQLFNQGLDGDDIRGAINSSSQRDPISNVFGISTPGRPSGKQDAASDPNLETRLIVGDYTEPTVTTRVGGHTLVMDDGDSLGKNNLFRLKSSSGHQILMHDTEGIVYVSNATGTAWVELTKAGDVLIYGAKDLAVRTGGNLMMHSDRNISFYASDSINLASGNRVNVETGEINQTALVRLNIFGKKIQARSASTLDIASSSSLSIRSGGRIAINGSAIALNGSGSAPNIPNPPQLQKYNLPDVIGQQFTLAKKWQPAPGKIRSTNYKVPTHEPYLRQGLRQAIEEIVAESNTYDIDLFGNPIDPPVIQNPLGPAAADNLTLYDAAPQSTFIDQVVPEGPIGELSTNNVRALTAQIAHSESRGDYEKIEPSGYVGKYQFSVDDLAKLGYVKEGLSQTIDSLNNPNNWLLNNNVVDLNDFLQSKELQEQAMFTLMKDNYATLQATGAIVKNMTTQIISGLLSVAHLAGAGGATTWFKTGKYAINANGYTAADYYNRGKFSTTQTDVYGPNQ